MARKIHSSVGTALLTASGPWFGPPKNRLEIILLVFLFLNGAVQWSGAEN